MPNGFPDGEFRVIHVQTGKCLHMDFEYKVPTVTLRTARRTKDELWYCDSARLVNSLTDPNLRGRFCLGDFGRRVSGTNITGIGIRWESSNGMIKVENTKDFMHGDTGTNTIWLAEYADPDARPPSMAEAFAHSLGTTVEDLPESMRNLWPPPPSAEEIASLNAELEAASKWRLEKG